MKYYKIKPSRTGINQDSWWATKEIMEPYGEIFRNMNGGFCSAEGFDILEEVEYSNYADFENTHRKEIFGYLIKPESKFGWLNPKGEFFGCDFTKHLEVAEDYFGFDEETLEKQGWIKIFKEFENLPGDVTGLYYRKYSAGTPVYYSDKITIEQEKFLREHNINISKYYDFRMV